MQKSYGRAGILAHSYMLGPNGQLNGCVSFSNYSEFLNTFLKGEVTRLVVVERLENPSGPKLASGWLPDVVRNLFKASDRAPPHAPPKAPPALGSTQVESGHRPVNRRRAAEARC